VFYKDESGDVFHTYSTYGRGLEPIITTYDLLDMTPKGRDDDGLYFPMAWIRHHDRYESGQLADTDRPYWPSAPKSWTRLKRLSMRAARRRSQHDCASLLSPNCWRQDAGRS
jgi:hypothetical protein